MEENYTGKSVTIKTQNSALKGLVETETAGAFYLTKVKVSKINILSIEVDHDVNNTLNDSINDKGLSDKNDVYPLNGNCTHSMEDGVFMGLSRKTFNQMEQATEDKTLLQSKYDNSESVSQKTLISNNKLKPSVIKSPNIDNTLMCSTTITSNNAAASDMYKSNNNCHVWNSQKTVKTEDTTKNIPNVTEQDCVQSQLSLRCKKLVEPNDSVNKVIDNLNSKFENLHVSSIDEKLTAKPFSPISKTPQKSTIKKISLAQFMQNCEAIAANAGDSVRQHPLQNDIYEDNLEQKKSLDFSTFHQTAVRKETNLTPSGRAPFVKTSRVNYNFNRSDSSVLNEKWSLPIISKKKLPTTLGNNSNGEKRRYTLCELQNIHLNQAYEIPLPALVIQRVNQLNIDQLSIFMQTSQRKGKDLLKPKNGNHNNQNLCKDCFSSDNLHGDFQNSKQITKVQEKCEMSENVNDNADTFHSLQETLKPQQEMDKNYSETKQPYNVDEIEGEQIDGEQTEIEQTEDEQTEDEQTEDEHTEGEQIESGQTEEEQTEGDQIEGEQTENEQTEDEQTEDDQTEDEQTEGEQTEDEQTEVDQIECEQFIEANEKCNENALLEIESYKCKSIEAIGDCPYKASYCFENLMKNSRHFKSIIEDNGKCVDDADMIAYRTKLPIATVQNEFIVNERHFKSFDAGKELGLAREGTSQSKKTLNDPSQKRIHLPHCCDHNKENLDEKAELNKIENSKIIKNSKRSGWLFEFDQMNKVSEVKDDMHHSHDAIFEDQNKRSMENIINHSQWNKQAHNSLESPKLLQSTSTYEMPEQLQANNVNKKRNHSPGGNDCNNGNFEQQHYLREQALPVLRSNLIRSNTMPMCKKSAYYNSSGVLIPSVAFDRRGLMQKLADDAGFKYKQQYENMAEGVFQLLLQLLDEKIIEQHEDPASYERKVTIALNMVVSEGALCTCLELSKKLASLPRMHVEFYVAPPIDEMMNEQFYFLKQNKFVPILTDVMLLEVPDLVVLLSPRKYLSFDLQIWLQMIAECTIFLGIDPPRYGLHHIDLDHSVFPLLPTEITTSSLGKLHLADMGIPLHLYEKIGLWCSQIFPKSASTIPVYYETTDAIEQDEESKISENEEDIAM